MSTHNENAMRAIRPALVAAAFGLTAAVTVNAIVALAYAAPEVGHIVTFAPSATELSTDSTRLGVHRLGRADCVLDLGVLRRSGGSLVVDMRLGGDPGSFRVHWAGARTSDDPRNCGGDVDLIVGRRDLDLLALAAGGYGLGAKLMPTATRDFGTIGN